jgi:hypothetical protein
MTSTELGASVESELSCHYTYCRPEGNNLRQGDVLVKDEQLTAAIKDHFRYYLRPDFTYFIVLSQSCDLIRRDGKPCEAQHITLAATRPLSLVLEFELRAYQDEMEKVAMVCSEKKKFLLEQFYERLLNNNNPEYFYLHEEPGLGFPESSCALLRLSISLETKQYYDICLHARIISLTEIFRAKLGWLVGNMYSRIGTEDWVPDHASQEEFRDRIKRAIDGLCPWIPDKKLVTAKKNAPPGLLTRDQDTIRRHIAETSVLSKKEEAIKNVLELLVKLGKVKDQEDEKMVRNRLNNDPELSTILK